MCTERFEKNYCNATTTTTINNGANNNNNTISGIDNYTANNALLESFRKTVPKHASKINVSSSVNIEEEMTSMEEENNNDGGIEMIMPTTTDHDDHSNSNGRNAIENIASL